MLTIDECWSFLESQLAPGFAGLPAGASARALDRAGQQLGVALPEDFRRWLGRHDGSGPCFLQSDKLGGGEQRFLALAEIVALAQSMWEIAADFESHGEFGTQHGPIQPSYWNRRWIPLADNGCGDNIVLDLDPPSGGTPGQLVDWWHEGGVSTLLAPSLTHWLNEVVQDLRQGACRFASR
jgi:cell wall assembly regulator SMI1